MITIFIYSRTDLICKKQKHKDTKTRRDEKDLHFYPAVFLNNFFFRQCVQIHNFALRNE